ncbi:putative ribosome biogenesis protein BOP1 [Cardamine amara subsp. amara]|uniref:Ribosome biogenesis protein BOP1 n=1 Tax=Cardamine amara subsp. amara TaxID=228776 RepID=A0ABD0ZK69_CARAN
MDHDSKNWCKIYDEYNDEEVELTKDERKLISRMLKGEAPRADFDPYAPYVDWFKWDNVIHPLSSAPELKRMFIPSKWEAKSIPAYENALKESFDRCLDLYLCPKEESED